ncbi:MAG: PadR family transcriptional regulator [Acidobacteria bacterium]|nr:PadR family transcriptional regulator [Acidobacteriota bacterium]
MSDSYLGEFEHMLLLVVLELGDDSYGARVQARLEERVGREASVGALYTTLRRLEAKGLLEGSSGETTPERSGRPRRYLSVTAEGMAALKRSRAAFLKLWEPVADTLEKA